MSETERTWDQALLLLGSGEGPRMVPYCAGRRTLLPERMTAFRTWQQACAVGCCCLDPPSPHQSCASPGAPCRRVGSARDAVKRGQEVWVKVLSISGARLSLSMRDVDQNTGKDLLPGAKAGTDLGERQRQQGVSGLHGLSGIRVQVGPRPALARPWLPILPAPAWGGTCVNACP